MDTSNTQDRRFADHAPPGRYRSDSTPPRNGMHFYTYRVVLDRGNVLRLIVEERVKTSAGSVPSATYRTDKVWQNKERTAAAYDAQIADPRAAAARYLEALAADPVHARRLPEGVLVVGVVKSTAWQAG